MPTYKTFEELHCYQKCREVRTWISRMIKRTELTDCDIIQNITRAGRSATRNIAEGFGRQHHKENIQFCKISVGSLHEILDDFNIMEDEELCTASDLDSGRKLVYQALKSTNNYITYLKSLIR